MGDILWAHLEMLQKEVDREKANLQNVPSGYSDSFTTESSFAGNRTYIQLDSTTSSSSVIPSSNGQPPAPPPLVPSTSTAMAIAAQQANSSSKPIYLTQSSQYPTQQQQQQQRHPGTTTSVTSSLIQNPITASSSSESWNNNGSNAGSIADGSEYSYHGGNVNMASIASNSAEMKYSHQMAVAAAAVTSAASRIPQVHHNAYSVPQYPAYHEYENNLWSNPHHQQHNPYPSHQSQQLLLNDQHNSQPQQASNQWHQPTGISSDFHPVATGKAVSPVSSATISPPLGLLSSTSLSNHIHQTPISGSQQIIQGTGMHQHPAFLQVLYFRKYCC